MGCLFEPKHFGMLRTKHTISQEIIDLLSHAVHHLPLGAICILSCVWSLGKTKTYMYFILWLFLHYFYEANGKIDQNINTIIIAILWEISAYIYNNISIDSKIKKI